MKCFNSASCAAIFAEKGVHIVVTRIDEMEHSLGERLRSAHEQVDIYRAKLQKDIINQLYMYGGQSPMNHILSLSAALNQHLFGKFVWRHFVALHNRKWFLMQCTVPTGIAGPVIQGLYAYNNKTEAVDDPFYSVANKYKIIFLL
ncbi:hypothetical protein niasHT_000846 [Heterodera trifolii]|uniref:Uncharacterized protein n=1 Tax=Heterodera trifolii TaxID=157864 RepID=A0ABD2LVA1_9BILA